MKKYFYILGSLQAFTAIGAIPAGIVFLMDTTGRGMGASPEILVNSPLDSFLLPGLFLVLINGIGNIAGAWLSFRKNRLAGYAGILLGVALALWIIIQVAWISLSSLLQPLYLVIGLVNIFLGWKIMKYFEEIKKQ